MRALRDLAVVGLGELLWDELPQGRRLGGAPANFAVMASRLGAHGIISSRLGSDASGKPDEPGEAARALLAGLPVDTRFLQQDESRPTGTVSVAFEEGQPQYIIHSPVAWDALAVTPEWLELAERADAVCWGTLAQRDAVSQQTIHSFLAATRPECLRIFDINLREPFFTADTVMRSLAKATLLKLNDAEMPHLLSLASLPKAMTNTSIEDADDAVRAAALVADCSRLLAAYSNLQAIAITLGAHGSLLVERGLGAQPIVERHHGVAMKVVDTVGAGDAFTAALAVHRLQGFPLSVQSEAANQWGAWVAGQAGAMPDLHEETLANIEGRLQRIESTRMQGEGAALQSQTSLKRSST